MNRYEKLWKNKTFRIGLAVTVVFVAVILIRACAA